MALTGCTSTVNYRRIVDALSPTLSSDNVLLICGFVKPATSEAGVTRGFFALGESASTTTHKMSCNIQSTNHASTRIYSNTTNAVFDATNSALSGLWDTWMHDALIVEGPHNGASRAWERRINDAVWDSGSFTSQTYTAALDTVYFGRSIEVAAGSGADKFAYIGVGSFASVAAARTAVTACQTTAPKSVSGFVHAWDMIADGDADLGGVNSSAVGTGGSFDADDPLAGVGATVKISACFMG